MRLWLYAVVAFAGAGAVGPLVRLLTWPPATLDETTGGRVSYFVYAFTLFLLPASPASVYVKSELGRVLLVVGLNVFAFALAGLAVGAAARSPVTLAFASVVAVGSLLVIPVSRFAGGFDMELSLALAMALLVYAVPCWLIWRRRSTG